MSDVLEPQDFTDAIDRIARTRDGAILYRYLQQALCAVTIDNSAFPRNEGRRMFASELMALMAEGVRTHDRTDSIVVFSRPGPRRDADAHRGARRRIGPDTPIPGWERAEDSEPA